MRSKKFVGMVLAILFCVPSLSWAQGYDGPAEELGSPFFPHLSDYSGQGYDSVAYSPSTGSHGTAVNFGSPQEATGKALGWCGQSDCKIVYVVTADNNAALAVSDDGSDWWAYDYSGLGNAQRLALQFCEQAGASGCRLAAWTSLAGSY